MNWFNCSIVRYENFCPPYETYRRTLYLYALVVVLVFAVASPITLLWSIIVLIYFTPFMALYYTWTCYWETNWLIKQEQQ
jgi:hypothetical protein